MALIDKFSTTARLHDSVLENHVYLIDKIHLRPRDIHYFDLGGFSHCEKKKQPIGAGLAGPGTCRDRRALLLSYSELS